MSTSNNEINLDVTPSLPLARQVFAKPTLRAPAKPAAGFVPSLLRYIYNNYSILYSYVLVQGHPNSGFGGTKETQSIPAPEFEYLWSSYHLALCDLGRWMVGDLGDMIYASFSGTGLVPLVLYILPTSGKIEMIFNWAVTSQGYSC